MKSLLKGIGLLAILLVIVAMASRADRILHATMETPGETVEVFNAMVSPDPSMFNRIISARTAHLRDEHGATPLCYAARLGKVDQVRKLLGYGAEIDAVADDGRTPLMFAAMENRVEVCRLLLDRGADTAGRTFHSGKTALDLAIQAEAAETVALLRQYGSVASTTLPTP